MAASRRTPRDPDVDVPDPGPGRPPEPPLVGDLIGLLAAVRRALPGLERDLSHPDPAVRVDAAVTILRACAVLTRFQRANADALDRLLRG